MEVAIEESWKKILHAEFDKEYFKNIVSTLKHEKKENKIIYPSGASIFKAFELTPFHKVKVVILGQDPYHGDKQAHGLSFSVPLQTDIPPSLRNIFKELQYDIHIAAPRHGNLESWAKQGVLLLNAYLTVEKAKPMSHSKIGWQLFTDKVIETISKENKGVVFLLWGSFAQEKIPLIDQSKHLVLTAPHPSPLSAHRGFFGCKHFSKSNEWLVLHGKQKINWQI